MKRRCKNCENSIVEKRINAKFCSSACRAEYWRNQNEEDYVPLRKQNHSSFSEEREYKPANKLDRVIKGLKGILPDKNTSNKSELSKRENPRYLSLSHSLTGLKRVLAINTNTLIQLERQKKNQEREMEMIFPMIGTTIGIVVDLPKTKKGKKGESNKVNPWLRGLTVAVGLVGGMFLGESQKKARLQSLGEIKKNIQGIKEAIIRQKDKLTNLVHKISKTPEFLIDKNDIENNPSLIEDSLEEQLDCHLVPPNEIDLNDKIICSNELKKMNFISLDFKGKWQQLFGKPAISFHLVIHGKPGQGKSTFSLQFANYLASNFGKVLFVSGEEGFSKTMKDKFRENNAYNDNLFLADIHSFKNLKEIVKPDTYHFIFIDSLNNMGIDIEQLKEMRELYKNSTLITISQSTKKGQLRGSLEIEHESDISLKIEDGFAFATKNRFKELGYEYSIFEDYAKQTF